MNERNHYMSLPEGCRPEHGAVPIEVSAGENIAHLLRWNFGTRNIPEVIVGYDGCVLRRVDGGLVYEPHSQPDGSAHAIYIPHCELGASVPGFTFGFLSNGDKVAMWGS